MKKIILLICLSVLFSFTKNDATQSTSKFEGTWKLYEVVFTPSSDKSSPEDINQIAKFIEGSGTGDTSREDVLECLKSIVIKFTEDKFSITKGAKNSKSGYCGTVTKIEGPNGSNPTFKYWGNTITFLPSLSIAISHNSVIKSNFKYLLLEDNKVFKLYGDAQDGQIELFFKKQ